jgi:DNA-3-methyladenine glycosylase I
MKEIDRDRCPWAMIDPLLLEYHDKEWGVPQRNDKILYEFLTLEGAQAGLSWLAILKKRENYRKAFSGFDPEKVASYTEQRIMKLKQDPGIIRNDLKIRSAVQNAKSLLMIRKESGSFKEFIWAFVKNDPEVGHWKKQEQVPATTEISDAMSKELKKRGFSFVGSTICYSFMQAVGLVNDHIQTCYRAKEV